jgi:hypothetical protein
MVMLFCGAFKYSGVVPEQWPQCRSWVLQDQSGAAKDPTKNPLFAYRLVGLSPLLEITTDEIVLRSSTWERSQWVFTLDSELLRSLRSGDSLNLVRTATGDIGVSLLRGQQLVFAVGAVSVVPTGADLIVRSLSSGEFLRRKHWLELSVSGEQSQLRGGQSANLGSYEISVLRCRIDGEPGTYECVATSHRGYCSHDSPKRSAQLLARQVLRRHPGLSDAMCAWKDCPNRALAAMAICFDHAYPE